MMTETRTPPRRHINWREALVGDRARTAVILVITAVWALNFAAGVFVSTYKAPPEINSIFMGTVGALLATAPIGSRRREDRDRQQRDDSDESGESRE
jgi:hypothetical protein